MILGHHYQRDSIVMHADFIGDSFMLSQKAADSNAEFIVFCGVHFMAESADILTDDDQSVILPNFELVVRWPIWLLFLMSKVHGVKFFLKLV